MAKEGKGVDFLIIGETKLWACFPFCVVGLSVFDPT